MLLFMNLAIVIAIMIFATITTIFIAVITVSTAIIDTAKIANISSTIKITMIVNYFCVAIITTIDIEISII